MIKINLLQNKGETKEQDFSDDFIPMEASGDIDQKELIVKFLIILSIPFLLFLYERYNLTSLKSDHRKIQGKITGYRKKLVEVEKKASKYKGINVEVSNLKNKLQALKKLSKFRLVLLRALDDLQSSLTEQIWLNSIKFKESRLEILGYATAEENLSAFEETLESKNGFNNVIIVKNEEIEQGTTILQKFQINSDLRAQE